MPRRDWRLFINDIVESILRIERYCQEMTYESFATDERTVDAVVRNITVIGEATRNIPAEVVARHSEIPWNEMRNMRNVVMHGYFGVSTRIVWETVANDLPPLVHLLKALLDAEQ